MKEVYIIISPDGSVGYNMFTGKGTATKIRLKKPLMIKMIGRERKGTALFRL